MSVVLRDLQKPIIPQIMEAYRQGHRAILICAPCGFGKSYVMQYLLDRATTPAITFCHRKELKEQHQKQMPNHRFELPITAWKMLQRGEIGEEGMVHNDEVHLSLADTWNALQNHYKQRGTFMLGWSATPERLDAKPLGNVYTALIRAPSVRTLIDNGYLADFKYYCPQIPGQDNLSESARNNPEGSKEEYENLFRKGGVFGEVVDAYKRLANGRKVIVYCINKAHAKSTAEAFIRGGINALSIDSDDPTTERSDAMAKFRSGEIRVLANCGLLSEGISIDDLDGVILLRPTASYALFVQQSMRPMRKAGDKVAVIIDMVNNYMRHGLPDEEHEFSLEGRPTRRRNKEFTDEGDFTIRYCGKCFQAFKTAKKCPHCEQEYELQPREIKEHKRIEIAEIKESQKLAKKMNMQNFNQDFKLVNSEAEAIALAQQYGYNPAFGKIRWQNSWKGRMMGSGGGTW